MRARKPHRSSESGQAMVELALIAPIVILLMMAIFQLAFIFEGQNGLTNAVREAARRAAANPDTTAFIGGNGTLQGEVQKELCGGLTPPCSGGLLEQNVPGFMPDRLAAEPEVTFCTYAVAGSSGTITNYQINVRVTYNHPEFFPLAEFAAFAAGKPSSGAWHWTLDASSQMRLESVDAAAAAAAIATPCP